MGASVLEINRLIAEVKEKDDVRILPGDPAFAIVTLNQLTLEDLANRLSDGLRAGIVEFNETVQKTEARAGAALAQHVKTAAAVFRQEIQKDIDAARLNADEAIRKIHRAHRRNLLICCGLLLVSALLTTFGIGVWVGTHG
jgi:hypothetical protein